MAWTAHWLFLLVHHATPSAVRMATTATTAPIVSQLVSDEEESLLELALVLPVLLDEDVGYVVSAVNPVVAQ